MSPTVTHDRQSALIPAAAERPADDPIFSLDAEARRRARAGEDVLNATLGALMEDDGRLAILPSVTEALGRIPIERAAAYAPIAGDPPFLRAVIADLFGADEQRAQAVAAATPGATGALHHAILNFLEPGQALLTTSYFWSPYHVIASHARRAVEVFETFDSDGRFHLRAFEERLHAQIARQGRALVILNFPCHNPTGYSLDEGEWRAVAEIVERAGRRAPLALCIDHAYARFGTPGSQAWVGELPRLCSSATLLVAWTVSKAFAQYGARVGALVALHKEAAERERIANALSYSCRATWSNCNHLGLLAITELLTDPELRSRSERERERLVSLLDERVAAFNHAAEQAGLRYPRYEGGFFVTVFTPDAARTAALMRERGVFVVPLEGAVRVALCSTPVRAVGRLVEALAAGVGAAEAAR